MNSNNPRSHFHRYTVYTDKRLFMVKAKERTKLIKPNNFLGNFIKKKTETRIYYWKKLLGFVTFITLFVLAISSCYTDISMCNNNKGTQRNKSLENFWLSNYSGVQNIPPFKKQIFRSFELFYSVIEFFPAPVQFSPCAFVVCHT